MTRYEYTINLKEKAENRAKKETDLSLKIFWTNAAFGYERRLERMTVEEASEVIA